MVLTVCGNPLKSFYFNPHRADTYLIVVLNLARFLYFFSDCIDFSFDIRFANDSMDNVLIGGITILFGNGLG